MALITSGKDKDISGRFTNEYPLHPKVAEQISHIFAQGWPDPSKSAQESSSLRPLIQEAKAIFASHLKVRSDELYFTGEPSLSFHLAVNGLLADKAENPTFHYSPIHRQPVHAIAHERDSAGLRNHLHEFHVKKECIGAPGDVELVQPINPETGIHTRFEEAGSIESQLVIDKTAYGITHTLPAKWSAAVYQSRAWQGPAGLGVLALRTGVHWRNPLPSIDNEKVPQSYSIPLLLISALSLEQFVVDYQESALEIRHLNTYIRNYLSNVIGDVIIAGEAIHTEPALISCAIGDIDSAKLVNDLAARGFAVDSGSACISSAMTPSHVLAAMGIPTQGNLRLTLHPQTTSDDVENLMIAVKECVMAQRTALQ